MTGRRAAWATALLWALVGVWNVAAHAELTAADPPPGATLDAAPTMIRLTFSEPPAAGSTLAVVDAAFVAVPGVVVGGGSAENELRATVPPLPPGRYTVEYDVQSQDGHTVRGSYTFAVAPPPERDGAQRWLGVTGALLALGVALLTARRLSRRAG